MLPGILRLVPETAQRVESREEPEKVTFSFYSLDGFPIDVHAEVSLNGDAAFWRLKLENRSEFAVRSIEYPWFVFRTPLGDEPESERILLPKQDGILLGNPSLHKRSATGTRAKENRSRSIFPRR